MKNKNKYKYKAVKPVLPMEIDGVWDKIQWQNSPIIVLRNYMGSVPEFWPVVKARLMYNKDNLYVIFQVLDRYVRCITDKINGPVWEDACVEFFFSPDTHYPERYFNLEINCGGTPLMHYNIIPGKETQILDEDDIARIEIAHSLPKIIDPEITETVTWTIEYKLPLLLLEKYTRITRPAPGVAWRANFFKIAENSTNPHYLTWTPVVNPEPDFHLPEFFGWLMFQ